MLLQVIKMSPLGSGLVKTRVLYIFISSNFSEVEKKPTDIPDEINKHFCHGLHEFHKMYVARQFRNLENG